MSLHLAQDDHWHLVGMRTVKSGDCADGVDTPDSRCGMSRARSAARMEGRIRTIEELHQALLASDATGVRRSSSRAPQRLRPAGC